MTTTPVGIKPCVDKAPSLGPTGTEIPVVVAGREDLGGGLLRLTLVAPGGGDLPSWRPGAHVTLLLDEVGAGVERQYSLCGPRLTPGPWQIVVARAEDGRGGSAWIHDTLAAGAELVARGPSNTFVLGRTDSYVFVAGGIGITPLLAMIAEVDAAGADWQLHWAARTAEQMPWLEELGAAHPGRVRGYVSTEGQRLPLPELVSGLAPSSQVYVCGPASMTDEIGELMLGAPEKALHLERFAPVELTEPVWPAPFDVELIFSGRTITVDPDQTLLEAAEQAGALTVASCREGTCGTCEVAVVMGEVDHRDAVLSPAERQRCDSMMICVSRAAGPFLSLEL